MVRSLVAEGKGLLRLVSLTVLLVAVACGTRGDDGKVIDGPSGSDEGVISSTPDSGGGQSSGGPDLAALPLAARESNSDPADLTGVPWTSLGTIEQGRTVAITYSLEACARPDHVDVAESDLTVSITVWALKADSSRPCAATSQIVKELVQLARPLDERELVDPTTVTG
jgi:hypothetical protein